MRKRTIARVLAVALGAALALGALAGCQSPATGATDQQQANRTAYKRRRVLIAQLPEQDTADNTRAAQDQQQNGGEVSAKARHNLNKRLNIAVACIICTRN